MSYIFGLTRSRYSGYNASADGGEIDADISWEESTTEFLSGYKATSFTLHLYNFLTSSTGSGRNYDFDINVKSNGKWYTLYTANGWRLPAKGSTDISFKLNEESVTSSAAQVAIGQYGIEQFQIVNGNYGNYGWTLRGCADGYGYIEFFLENNITEITPPSSITTSSTTVAPNNNVTISWSGQDDGIGTSIWYYDLLVVNSSTLASWWYSEKYGSTISASSDSATIQFDSTGSYNVFVYAYDTYYGDQYADANGANVKITVANVTNPGEPTLLKVNNATTLYIGSSNSPAISFSWTAPTNSGTLNSIASYSLYKSGNSSALKTGITATSVSNIYTTSNSASEKVGTYYVKTIGSVSGTNSENSSAVAIKLMSTPNVPTITSALPTTTSNDISLSWTEVEKPTGCASITYTVAYALIGGSYTTLKAGLTSTSYTFPITTVPAGNQFNLRVIAVATASGGGTINSVDTSSTITRSSDLKFSDTTITIKNDNNSTITATAPYAYSNVTINWSKASSSTSTSIKYTIRYKTTNSQWTDLIANLTTLSYTFSNFGTKVSEGDIATFKIIAIDENGSTVETETATVIRMTKPIVTVASMNGITFSTIGYSFSYDFNVPSETLNCEVSLGYNGLYDSLINTHTLTQSSATVSGEDTKFTIDLSKGAGAATTTMIGALYNKVIAQKYAKPAGTLRIVLSSSSIPACSTTHTINFTYNFVTDFTSGTITAGYQQNKSFYNPGDTIQLYFTPANWTDAAGGTTGATLSYYISGNNNPTTNREPETIITDIAPNARDDLTLVYKVVSKVEYADYTQEVSSASSSVQVARWTDSDIIYLSSISKTNDTINGHLILPELLCGSGQYENVTGVTYTLRYADTDAAIDGYTDVVVSDVDLNDKDISFSFENTSEESVSLYAEATFTNTSDNTIKKISTTYLLRAASVPLAIRKGRVGINVDSSNFIVDADDANVNSALYVAALSDTASILELSAGSNSVNPSFINFFKGNTSLGNIYYNETDALFHCNKWYYPVSSVNDKTGAITLSASDVGARANDWMPSQGNGITISGDTISNSGVLSIATGSTNGTISVNTNGTSAEVAVKGLGSNAYTSTAYLPLSGGTMTGILALQRTTSIANNYYAGINFKLIQSDNNITSTSAHIRVYDDHDANTYGVNMVLNSGGNMIVGGGESATACYTTDLLDSTGENLYLTADSTIYFYPACNTYANHKTCYIDTTGQFYSEGIRGKAIQYTDDGTIPTGTAVGQIWLKKKGT